MLNKKITSISVLSFSIALLAACSGGSGDATAPTETPVSAPTPSGTPTPSATPTPTPTSTSTPASPAAEPTTGYGYVTNPACGNYGNQSAKDYSTGLIWGGKNQNPAYPRGIGRTFSNYDNGAAMQVRVYTYLSKLCETAHSH